MGYMLHVMTARKSSLRTCLSFQARELFDKWKQRLYKIFRSSISLGDEGRTQDLDIREDRVRLNLGQIPYSALSGSISYSPFINL